MDHTLPSAPSAVARGWLFGYAGYEAAALRAAARIVGPWLA